jgi:hypothetical protein
VTPDADARRQSAATKGSHQQMQRGVAAPAATHALLAKLAAADAAAATAGAADALVTAPSLIPPIPPPTPSPQEKALKGCQVLPECDPPSARVNASFVPYVTQVRGRWCVFCFFLGGGRPWRADGRGTEAHVLDCCAVLPRLSSDA